MKVPQKILVPSDFSKYSDLALRRALLLAKEFGAQVFLLHVVPDILQCAEQYCLPQEMVEKYRKDSIAAAQKQLLAETKKYADAKDVKITTNVRIGSPSEEILQEEKEKKIDLIVIAAHGQTGFLKQLMGSVSSRVSREAKGQVMLVKS